MDLSRTAVGRAYLAALSETDRQNLLIGLQAATGDDWGNNSPRLDVALRETTAQGFAIATGEWYEGLNAIAAGFIGPSGERYAVNCGGSAHQCPRDWLVSRAAPALLETIDRIVHEIGGTPGRRLDN
jgi:DNA-binding IclR family transcriptional regulator